MKAYAVAEGEGMKWRGERVAPKYPENLEHKVVDALAAAGLLVTPAMERAVEACCEYARRKLVAPHHWQQELIEAGDAILAERAAREKPEQRASPWYRDGTNLIDSRTGMLYDIGQMRMAASERLITALNREGGGRG